MIVKDVRLTSRSVNMLQKLLDRNSQPDGAAGLRRSGARPLTKPPGSPAAWRSWRGGSARCPASSRPGAALRHLHVAPRPRRGREGVSAYPQVVTAQMVENFLKGGAAVNVLARQWALR